MSFAVTAVVDIDDCPAEPSRLLALRERFADLTTVVLASAAGSPGDAAGSANSVLQPGVLHVADSEVAQLPSVAGAQFVWFLPAGAVPDPESLPALIEALTTAESLGAAGPKLLAGAEGDRRSLVSAGVTTTPQGLRVNPVAPGEVDQGQYDRRQDTLAVDVPGMLVRAELVSSIGVPSRVLSSAYRGIEYSRRVRGAGYRVGLVPQASVRLPAAAAAGYRSSARPLTGQQALREEHRYRLAVTPRSRVSWTVLKLFAAALLAGLGRLLANDPSRALWCLRSAFALPADVRATSKLRRSRSGHDGSAQLFAGRRELEIIRRELRGNPATEQPDEDAGGARRDVALNTSGEVAGFSGIDTRSRRSLLFHPLTAVLFVTLLGSGLLFHSLIGPGAVGGGALPRFDVAYPALIERILVPVSELGLGSVTVADPVLSVFAVLGLLFLGDLDLMIRVLWFAALPLAALVMYLCAGRIAPPSGVRGLLALVWACSPAFLFSLIEGRYGTVLAWICAPAACWALERAVRLRRSTAAAGAGLALAVMLAGSPVLVVPVLGGLIVLLAVLRRSGLVWTILPSLALLAPWLLAAVDHLDVFLTNPGRVFDYATPASFELAFGYPAQPQSALLAALLPDAAVPWVLLAIMLPLLFAGVLALTRIQNSLALLAASTVLYGTGLAGGVLQAAFGSGLTADGLVASFTGDSLLIMGLGAVGFVASALWPTDYDRASRLRALSVRLLVPATALIVLTLFVGQSLLAGIALQRSTSSVLPAFAAERSAGPLGQRTLVLQERGGQLYGTLASASSGTVVQTATLHEAAAVDGGLLERRPVALDEADTALAITIGRLTAGDGADARDGLRSIGVGFVVVTPDSGESLTRLVSVSPGLTRLGDTDLGHLWQVVSETAPISYASVVADDGAVEAVEVRDGTAQIPPGDSERRLVLAERAGLTRAAIDGTELPVLDGDWQAAFAVPADGGELRLTGTRPAHAATVLVGWAVVLVAVLVAIPFGAAAQTNGRAGGGSRASDRAPVLGSRGSGRATADGPPAGDREPVRDTVSARSGARSGDGDS
ncbi:hypothetical protein GCM10022261_26520 [Brevibacterium daeguense]|uniref:Glycosyltransferase family 2 protein n=1 Tax=Brevibacterium daeguense TaxID=909936 RepID=A0ABP8EMC0_9MICO|nr:hypothetical protein [Brevibacterium daeguense]